MTILEQLLEILERRHAAWDAAHLASDHSRAVRDADERYSVISIASQRSEVADEDANKVERELVDFVGVMADDIMEELRAAVGKTSKPEPR